MDLKNYIRDVPDFPKPGIVFKDITPLLTTSSAFQRAIDMMIAPWEFTKTGPWKKFPVADAIAALDARGFIFGAAMALELEVPLILIRKKGKLPWQTKSVSYDLEYGTDTLEVHVDSFVKEDMNVVVVDDLLATGGTAKAACSLIKKLGARVVGCQFLIELAGLNGRAVLQDYDVRSLLVYS